MRNTRIAGLTGLLVLLLAGVFVIWEAFSFSPARPTADATSGGNERGKSTRYSKGHSSVPIDNQPIGNVGTNGKSKSDFTKSTAQQRDTSNPEAGEIPPARLPGQTRFHDDRVAEVPSFGRLVGWIDPETWTVGGTATNSSGTGKFVDMEWQQLLGRVTEFSPHDPDGVLDIDLRVQQFNGSAADGARLSLTVIRTRDSAAWTVECPNTEKGLLRVWVPVAEGDSFQLQVVSGDNTTALAHIPCAMVSSSNQLNQPVYDLYRRGRVSLEVRLVPRDANPQARPLLITDGQGRPLKDAVVLCEAQELGRSGADGVIRWPLMPVRLLPSGLPFDKPKVRDLCYVVHAPGYVPIMLTRSEVEQTDQGTLSVVMRAPEFVATVYASVSDERCLYLGARRYEGGSNARESQILRANWDLLPLRPEMTVSDWQTAYRELKKYNRTAEYWQRNPPGSTFGVDAFAKSRGEPRVSPFARGDSEWIIDETWADGLEAALERPYHPYWSSVYGGWYCRRWRYKDGRFDIALPYPGKFLLLVGEEFRENASHSLIGQINHILYIDATDQDNVKGELFRCPG